MLHLSSNTIYLLKKEMPELFNNVTSGAIILLMDASYHAVDIEIKEKISQGLKVYVLKDDVKRRGLLNMLIEGVKVINYDEFIDLVMDPDTKTLNL